jgi:two-component system cell cycle sensor histidine kinase/response regulator CckA
MAQIIDIELANEEWEERAPLFRVFAENSLDIIRLIEPTGRVVYASPSAVRFLGEYPKHHFERLHASDLDEAQRWWAGLLKNGSGRFDARIQSADGGWHWFETWGTRVRHRGNPLLLAVSRDITERVQAVEALRDGKRKLEDAQQLSQIGYWDNDLELDRIVWSDETYRILGLEKGSVPVTAATLRAVIHPDDRQLQAEATAKARSGDGRYDVEYRVVRPDGEVRTIHSLGDVVRDSSGRLCRAFGVVHDITELKSVERALRASHGLLNAIMEGTTDAVFAKDTGGRYLMMNTAGARFLGKPVEEIIGRTDAELYPAAIASEFMERDRQVLESGKSSTFEEEHTVEGATRMYVVTKSVHRDWRGHVIGLVGISSEVTELKGMEKQFREAQKMEAVGRLAGGVAHDFNNLLTVINGHSEMVLNDLPRDHPERESLLEIRKAGDRAAALTHQLLAFSRNQILQPRVVNLNATLRELVKLLCRLIGEDVDLQFIADEHLGMTKVDPMQLDQAIINLAVNARDAMPDGGRLRIETRNIVIDPTDGKTRPAIPGRYIAVSVSDTGHGMDKATAARVFEPFFTTKKVGKGTGLGLSMVYGFVNQSGGQIEMQTKVGQGTTFTIYLPESFESDTVPEKQPAARGAVGVETILLVEDEEAVRNLCRAVLESRGYTVLEARDGKEGLSIAQSYDGTIHLLLSDLIMPRASGREIAEELGSVRPEMRVLFMSGYTDEANLPGTVNKLRGRFLQKPFTPGDLAQKIRDLLDE